MLSLLGQLGKWGIKLTINNAGAWIYAFLSTMSYRPDEKDYRFSLEILQERFSNAFTASDLEFSASSTIHTLCLPPRKISPSP